MSRSRSFPSPVQPDLLGGTGTAEVHRLFFALMPGEAVARQFQVAAADVAASRPLQARMIRPSRYHMTLHFLGDHPALREDIARAAIAAAGKVSARPFEVVMDEASGFKGREPPCILRCSTVPDALQRFWDDLRQALLLAGLGQHLAKQFTPHVTFAYSRGEVPASTAIHPVRWPVDGFSLVHSVIGGGDYRTLESWRFSAE